MGNETLHIVLSLQDKEGDYSQHTAVVMASIMANTKEKICFHIFSDDTLAEGNKRKLTNMVRKKEQAIVFHQIELDLAPEAINAVKYISMGTLFRLKIADELKDVSRALYLDGDIVVNLDVAELFATDLKDKAIAAVIDAGTKKNPKLYNLHIPVKVDHYFNAGVILFDLAKIREHYPNLAADCLGIIKENPKDYFTDQSALNHFLQDDCLFIDEKYNSFPSEAKDDLDRVCIWHFAGGYKPWKMRKYKIDMLYWLYFRLTPWGTDDDEVFKLYSGTVAPLDDALLTYPISSRRKFFKNTTKRIFAELKKLFKQFI